MTDHDTALDLGEVHQAVEHAADVEPRSGLEAVGALQRWLEDREDELVTKAIVEGLPCSEINRLLGRGQVPSRNTRYAGFVARFMTDDSEPGR